MPSFPTGRSPMTCDHTVRRSETLGSNTGMSAGDGRTTELRIRISRRGNGSARFSDSRAPAQRRNSCQPMPPSRTSSAISPQPKPPQGRCDIERFYCLYLPRGAGLNKFKRLVNRPRASKQPFLTRCDNAVAATRRPSRLRQDCTGPSTRRERLCSARGPFGR